MTTRRGTANILVGLSGPLVQGRLRHLTARTDVLALQEWPRSRGYMLRDLAGAWDFRRPLAGGGPIGIRRDLGETVLSCRAVALTGPGYVGRIPGRRSVLGPSWATRLTTRRPDGQIVVRYNIHLTASVQLGREGYRREHTHRRRVTRHRAERRTLARLVARDHARGHVVEVYGDTNYHHMPIPGLYGWWRVRPNIGTFGDRAIDGIWTDRRPDTVRTLPPLVPGEHRHVITHTEER